MYNISEDTEEACLARPENTMKRSGGSQPTRSALPSVLDTTSQTPNCSVTSSTAITTKVASERVDGCCSGSSKPFAAPNGALEELARTSFTASEGDCTVCQALGCTVGSGRPMPATILRACTPCHAEADSPATIVVLSMWSRGSSVRERESARQNIPGSGFLRVRRGTVRCGMVVVLFKCTRWYVTHATETPTGTGPPWPATLAGPGNPGRAAIR
jgi:hypothetical protein